MQQKISEAPPLQIKIVEGKPPPNSWVDENIVKYYQIHSRVAFLTDLVIYMQDLQGEKLAKIREKPLNLKETFVPLPEKGSPADMSNIAIYNAAQGYIKIQMEYLASLALIIKAGNPNLSEKMNPLLDQIKQMSQSFPHLSEEQLHSLSTIMDELLDAAKQLPLSYRRTFWNFQLNMLQTLMRSNGANIKDFQNEIKELAGRSQLLRFVEDLIQKIQNALLAQPPSEKEFLELIEHLQNLANLGPQLNEPQNFALANFFQQLTDFKNDKGQPLSQVIADVLVQNKLSAFVQQNPNATPEQIRNFLKNFLQGSNLQNSHLSFMKSLGDSIEDILSKKSFPATSGYSGEEFATIQDSKVKPNEDFIFAILASFAPAAESTEKTKNASKALTATTSEEIENNASKTEAYSTTVNKLSETQNNYAKAAAWTAGQSLSNGQPIKGVDAAGKTYAVPPPGVAVDGNQPLPYQFAHAILDHFMPGQEAYLQELAMVLYLDNNGAMFGNSLLEDMMGFDGASNTFSWGNSLRPVGGSGDQFSGSPTEAQDQLDAEKAACTNSEEQVSKSIKDIDKQRGVIQEQLKNKDLTDQQRKILTDEDASLQKMENNLKVLYNPTVIPKTGQLVDLLNALNAITIGPPVINPGFPSFTVFGVGTHGDPPVQNNPPAGWQSAISHAEGYVINGNPTLPDPGGLVNVATQAQTFQQTYSDQGQNMQMILQMHMTEIQQEWTVVSTSLQLLNQMYMVCAQGIYK